ncbi:protein of unknown function (plasmid) [Shinella sp. WSC3-e]|nr:hypothetical protein SHINE37_30046 [Rhizobiaceae bacterium]CAK7261283.1 protein of unknown function [Shinella sp. WSC3-e]
MNCIDCRLIHYAKASSPFNGIHRPFVYVVYSECVARAAFRLDPQLSIFKLGFSGGGQDRFRSLIEGWVLPERPHAPLGQLPALGEPRRLEDAHRRGVRAEIQGRGAGTGPDRAAPCLRVGREQQPACAANQRRDRDLLVQRH